MKVRLETIDIPDDVRQALRQFYGRKGLATRKEVQADLEGLINTYFTDLVTSQDADVDL